MRDTLFTGWCVMVKPKRGAWWSAPEWCARTRSDAVAAYLGCDNKHDEYYRAKKEYARDVRRGVVKLVRVEARIITPTREGSTDA